MAKKKQPEKVQGAPSAYTPRFERLGWEYYAPGANPPMQYTDEELRRIVRKAAKAANQRIRGIEKAGVKSAALKSAMANMDGKSRFKERVKTQTRAELMREFVVLREFMTSQTSTVKGVNERLEKLYKTYMAAGFNGTQEELEFYIEKYLSQAMAKFYGSDVLHQLITENRREDLDDYFRTWKEEQRKEETGEDLDPYAQGRALLRMLHRKGK